MLAPPTGNLLDVWKRTQAAERRSIKRQAVKAISTVVRNARRIHCEIEEEDACGDWYLLKCRHGEDMRALRWLS